MKSISLKALLLTASAALGGYAQAQSSDVSCGYAVETGTRAITPHGFVGWARVANVSGPPGAQFELLLDVGDATIRQVAQADFTTTEDGVLITAPSRFQKHPLAPGKNFTFNIIGEGTYSGTTPYLLSVNGIPCDDTAPTISLSGSQTLFTNNGTLTLTAAASDDVDVRKVVFLRNGEVIAEDASAPFTLELDITSTLNGRSIFTATAYDPSGNSATSDSFRVFTAIGNRFLGTAPGSAADFATTATYFNQITPEDAGKWGSVEAARDVMDWSGLDQAYQFARQHGFPFKLHTLIWGQQAPAWLNELPAAEQLEEIEEWMALLAARYPDVDSIDVVNEPLHAPPAFTEALGGAGETGWDWVVKSFELARSYFPKAELLLNDYQVEILKDFSFDYLEVIQPLLERDLIDGIGVQAHFLERADVTEVVASLNNLAATGLPIYISEFDLNISNDALHAIRMRELVTVFWDNPSVVGITHWGHLQGDVWRENAYLIRQDGTLRPGFQWLLCHYAGNTDCPVPVYTPEGWSGNAEGLLLQAEEYDEGQGVLALGNQIAYVDNGDWVAFKKVNFLASWDQISLTYLKGSEDPGSVSFHLGSLEAPTVLEIPLSSTGGWGTAQTINLPWGPISGEQDLYVRFHGSYGVANVDSIHFHAPQTEPGLGPNLVANSGFENGTASGWFSWDGQVSATTARAYAGDYSLLLSNRSGNGPAVYSLMSQAIPGASYEIKLMASIGGAASADVNVTAKIACDGNESYPWLINPTPIIEGEWVQLSGQLNVPQCNITDLLIFAEGPAGGIDIYLDEVSVRQILTSSNLMPNGDFENGSTSGWFSWGGTVGVTSSQVYEGNYALALTNRNGNGPAVYNLTSLLQPGASYNVSLAVTIQGASEAPVNITRKVECAGVIPDYTWIADTNSVAAGSWTVLSGTYNVPACDIVELLIYVEGPADHVDIFVDDVQITAL
jgi:endo-1,4-beta-xylanase